MTDHRRDRSRPHRPASAPRRRPGHRRPDRRSPAPAPRPTGPARLGPVDTVLDTTGLTGVIAHNPGDMTVVGARRHPAARAAGRAGRARPARRVRRRPGRRRAPPSAGWSPPPTPGPAALVYGSLRDLVIGVTVVLADGTVARSGGHVIKNVAGYDLAKLLHGSLRHARRAGRGGAAAAPGAEGAAPRSPWRARSPRPPSWPPRCSAARYEPAALEWIRTRRRPAAGPARRHRRTRSPARTSSALRAGLAARLARARRAHARGRARRARSRGRGTRRSSGVRRRARGAADRGAARAGCPACSARCPATARHRGPGHRGRHRAPCRRTRSPTRTRPCTPPAARRCCAPGRPAPTCPAWGPPPSALPVLRGAQGRARPGRPLRSRPLRPLDVSAMTTPAGSAETNLPQTGPSAFDEHRPPERELLDDCVHCGFCLPTCPTYQLWGEEMDSPRGRIYLMDLAEKGEIALDGPFTEHIDACLGCMACVTACPSGVQYDRLLESVRPQIERNVARATPATGCSATRSSRCSRTGAGCGPRPLPGALYQRLRRVPAIAALARRLPGRLARDGVAAAAGVGARGVRPAAACTPRRPAPGAAGWRCCPAACRTCSSTGSTRPPCGCSPPRATTWSCPATSSAAARWSCTPGARSRRWRGRGAPSPGSRRSTSTACVTNVAGCGSSMKEYGHLLADDPEWAERAAAFSARVRDVHEVLADGEPQAPRHPIRGRVAYHDACHLGHAQGVRAQPRAVLRSDPRSWSWSTCPRPRCAAARPASTTWSRPRRPPSWARARRPTSARPGRTWSSPPTPAACCRSASTCGGRAIAAAAPGPAARRQHPRTPSRG